LDKPDHQIVPEKIREINTSQAEDCFPGQKKQKN